MQCGICVGGNTKKTEDGLVDCAGKCGGNSYLDNCSTFYLLYIMLHSEQREQCINAIYNLPCQT